ncbi:MAG: DUF2723 domain-containing protein [Bacteroidetes bacterium]|nr:MAG: DUF2723 domain-containing protein [Bacteroidota bacterium]
MEHTKLNKIVAAGVFVVSLAVYVLTLADTVVFWDVGEFIAASYLLQVPHPPGSPLFLLIGNIFGMVMTPFYKDPAVRVHFISALSSALTVLFLYLSLVKLIILWRPRTDDLWNKATLYGASAVGALSLTFSATFWFNAVEAEVYGISMLFVGAVTWLSLRWNERADTPSHQKYILLIAYLIGLSLGVHLLALLVIFPFLIIVFFRRYDFSVRNYIIFGAIAVAVFAVVYPGIVKILPSLLDGKYTFGSGKESESVIWTLIPLGIIGAALYGVWYSVRERKEMLHLASMSFLLILLGYSTYTMVIIRANARPPMNENDPSTLEKLVSYLNREQYGEAPLMQRRWSQEPQHQGIYTNYKSDWDYFLRYQMDEMFLRYFLWQYAGREGDWQGAGVNWKQLWGIPLFVGLFGFYYHWKRDKAMWWTFFNFFLLMGFIMVFYFNMQNPQPRERDYFYVGAFFVFSLWIGIGAVGILDTLREMVKEQKLQKMVTYAVLALLVLFIPVNMLYTNFTVSDRSGDYVAWDYSYNLLQSCEPDAILFTNGDNDTFPLWYLQDVEGVRRDVRIVNLSLVNTSWYIMQLKHETPHGAKKVPISLSDAEIAQIGPMQWEPREVVIPVPPHVMKEYEQFNMDRPAQPAKSGAAAEQGPGVVRFVMPNSIQFGDIKAIRAQDIMAYDIIRTNNWERPVYMAVTSSPDSKIGLDRYFRMDGLAMKLIPYAGPTDEGAIDERILSANLMQRPETPNKQFQRGYLFRGLQDSTVFYDENVKRLVMNYRNGFMRLALHYLNVTRENDKAVAVLDSMQALMPNSVMPMDYRVEYDLTNFYYYSGDRARYRQVTDRLIATLKVMTSRPVTEPFQSQYHPYYMLFSLYQNREEYDLAIATLDTIAAQYGKVQGLPEWVAMQRAQMQARLALQQTAAKDTAAK